MDVNDTMLLHNNFIVRLIRLGTPHYPCPSLILTIVPVTYTAVCSTRHVLQLYQIKLRLLWVYKIC